MVAQAMGVEHMTISAIERRGDMGLHATDRDLQRWLHECCEHHPQNISAERTLVFECWCLWSARTGLDPGSKREWATLMQHAGFHRVRAHRINGIRLQSWALGMVMAERRNCRPLATTC
jgi:hypothetical protein